MTSKPSREGATGEKAMTLHEALVLIEGELGISPPMGANELPLSARFRPVLLLLKSSICPHRDSIKARLPVTRRRLDSNYR